MANSTGSRTLDTYKDQITYLGEFQEKFSIALSAHLAKSAMGYNVTKNDSGFVIGFHGLSAEFSYRAIGKNVRIKSGERVSSSEYYLTGHLNSALAETGSDEFVDFECLVRDLINPVLEDKVSLWMTSTV